jgi:hypothetical protein
MEDRGKIVMDSSLTAPCGMNCALCLGYQRKKNTCPGCRYGAKSDSSFCRKCVIRNCETVQTSASGFCFECEKYPCTRLKNLDKRYRTKYGMSMLENLNDINAAGMNAFIKNQIQRWTCPACGGLLCVHRNVCLKCGTPVPAK